MIERFKFLGLGLVLYAAGCGQPIRLESQFAVGSYTGTVAIAAHKSNQLPDAVNAVYGTMVRVLAALDADNSKSDIYRLNAIGSSSRWPIPGDTFRILDLTHHYSQETDGALDITLGPIAELWGLRGSEPPPDQPPAQEVIAATLKGVGESSLKLSDDGTAAFYSPLTRIDLGNMSAGYVVDMGIVNLKRQNITNVMVRLHQTARALGVAGPGDPWHMEVPDPWGSTQRLGVVSIYRGEGLAIARLYERTVKIADTVYGHIIDPRNGRPAEGTAMAIVTGPTATMANALAQALVVLGLEKAPDLLHRFPRCEVLIVPDRKPPEVWVTTRFGAQFQAESSNAAALRIINRGEPEPSETEPESSGSL